MKKSLPATNLTVAGKKSPPELDGIRWAKTTTNNQYGADAGGRKFVAVREGRAGRILFKEIQRQKKKLVSFDVVETAYRFGEDLLNTWSSQITARLIYNLTAQLLDPRR